MNLALNTPPGGRKLNKITNVKHANQKYAQRHVGDTLMREIDALEGAAIGNYSLRSQSQCCKIQPKIEIVLGAGIVIPDDDLSSIGSQEDDDDEMFLCFASSQETEVHILLTPNSIAKKNKFSLTPRKSNEVSLLSIPQVSPLVPKKTVSRTSQKRKRDSI
jgi:hypothetical protein